MVQTPLKPISLKKFLQLPETKPASEYINGEISQKPMGQGEHSTLQTELASYVNFVLKKNKIARAFVELRCIFADRAIVPNIAVLTWDKIPRETDGKIGNVFNLAPDWLIEILSLEQSQTKVTKKILHALKYGTQMGWLIDPSEMTIFVYQPKQEIAVFENNEDVLIVPDFAQDLELSHGDLFGWLLE
jgi:Uma2 family endonuclease